MYKVLLSLLAVGTALRLIPCEEMLDQQIVAMIRYINPISTVSVISKTTRTRAVT